VLLPHSLKAREDFHADGQERPAMLPFCNIGAASKPRWKPTADAAMRKNPLETA
jgi:hypothetical protein